MTKHIVPTIPFLAYSTPIADITDGFPLYKTEKFALLNIIRGCVHVLFFFSSANFAATCMRGEERWQSAMLAACARDLNAAISQANAA